MNIYARMYVRASVLVYKCAIYKRKLCRGLKILCAWSAFSLHTDRQEKQGQSRIIFIRLDTIRTVSLTGLVAHKKI